MSEQTYIALATTGGAILLAAIVVWWMRPTFLRVWFPGGGIKAKGEGRPGIVQDDVKAKNVEAVDEAAGDIRQSQIDATGSVVAYRTKMGNEEGGAKKKHP